MLECIAPSLDGAFPRDVELFCGLSGWVREVGFGNRGLGGGFVCVEF